MTERAEHSKSKEGRRIGFWRLCRKHGTARVAEVLGVSEGAVANRRRGYTHITIRDLWRLEQAFPDFSSAETIRAYGPGGGA